ncbi:MAG: M18 family aminopeptidase [Pseudomonadota bacterium]
MSKHTAPLLEYLTHSPTPFHAVENALRILQSNGFDVLDESEKWHCRPGGKYAVTRNGSSLVAFELGKELESGFRMIGAHTDSPCLRVKPEAVSCSNGYARLAVEVYGGVLLNPWFDRDLSLAGRVTVHDGTKGLKHWIVDFKRALAFIPSLAIHLDREVNEKRSINKQLHLPPVLCRVSDDSPDFHSMLRQQIKKEHNIDVGDNILAFELSLYDTQPAATVGLEDEFIVSARLDNLLSCHAGIQALTQSDHASNSVLVLNDHEEVGSASASGAEGPFLQSVLERLCGTTECLRRCLDRSMLISADNAHGVHPNFADKHEPAHQPLINAGPVVKINNNQRYATNSETEGFFRLICNTLKVPCQTMVVRSDMGCGSTIGPITATRLGVRTIDIGAPQLGMHSIREMAGCDDQRTMTEALKGFLSWSDWPF